jgi:hypothetical protein
MLVHMDVTPPSEKSLKTALERKADLVDVGNQVGTLSSDRATPSEQPHKTPFSREKPNPLHVNT